MRKLIALPLLALTFACGAPEEIPVEELADASDGKADGVRSARFELFTGEDDQIYFHLLAGNGQKVLHSEGYTSQQGALAGIASVRANGQLADRYQVLEASNGQWYFNLKAGNGEIVGSSELYVSRSNAERGLTTVMGLVQGAAEAEATTGARFEVFRGLDGRYYFHLRARNGEIVLQSQGYTAKSSALSGIASVRTNGVDLDRYQIRDAADGQAYFVLVAGNGRVIGVSETYASRSNARRGAEGVADLLACAAAF